MLNKVRRSSAVAVFLLLLGSLGNAAPSAAAADTVPTEKITVDVVAANGSGCPNGSASVMEHPDNTGFTVTYSAFRAQVGVGSIPTDIRKNCQLGLLVHVPDGFTYAIGEVEHHGYAHLEPGARGQQRSRYYYAGQAATASSIHNLTGPYDNDWQFIDTTDVAALVYNPCGLDRMLNINTELRVYVGTSDAENTTSFMVMDFTRGSVQTSYHFRWRRCP